MWWWGAQMLRNCTEDRYRINKGRMVRISNYSRDAMTELLAEEDIAFDMREQGTLQLFRTEKQLKGSKADQEVLAAARAYVAPPPPCRALSTRLLTFLTH